MPSASYFDFAVANRRFLGFGFFLALSSSFGQTYYIGIFGPAVQQEFGLSHTAWGSIYMAGTLASAAILPWTGKLIDRLDLRHYTAAVCALMALACGFMSVVPGPLLLVLAVFGLRQSGQGLLSHVALTSMARYFDANRGRGIAIASLGFSLGEGVLPFAAVSLIAAVGWRHSYALAAAVVLCAVLPGALWLLRGHAGRHRDYVERQRGLNASVLRGPAWTRAQVLRDARFYLLLPGIVAPSLVMTALFFHHLNLADAKGWSHAWITGNYAIFAALTLVAALVNGPLIDRFGALRLLPVMLVPMALAMLVVASFQGPWVVLPYMALFGVATGMAHTLGAAVWAELYGVTHLGAIKSMAASLGVFSSALGPVTAGVLMDAGMALESVCLLFAIYTTCTILLALVALSRPPSVPRG